VAELEKTYAAIFVAVGLGPGGSLGLPGEELNQVIDALKFIAGYKTEEAVSVGRKVAVIGGGNTAIDAANAALRLGAEEVYMVYRRSEREMPAFQFEYENAKLEGVRFRFQTLPVAIRAEGLECVRIELGAPDESGRRKPEPVPGSNFLIECDMIIPAIGQSRFLEFLREFRGVELRAGSVVVNPETGQTSNPRYYAGGDCVNGGREVVDAVAEGKRAGLAMAKWLESQHG
jgi:glutamate synthase (NADPH/NADH) small chain